LEDLRPIMIEVVNECLEMRLRKRKESTFTLEFNKVLTKFHRKGLEMLMKLAGPEKMYSVQY